jgi:ABC-type phosphate transport system substrate-binding protein
MKKLIIATVLILTTVMMGASLLAAEKQIVAGAGPSTKIVQLFFDKYSVLPDANKYEFMIPPKSAKHAGGIRCSSNYVFGRTGRPLNAKEKAMNKEEIFLAQIPVAIAVGAGVGVDTLDMGQLEKIFAGQYKNWKEVGGPDVEILVLGREQTEALFSILKSKYSFFEDAKFSKVFKKDDHIVSFLESPQGKYAIGFGAEPNFKGVEGLKMVSVDGFEVGVSVGLVYDLSNSNHPLIQSVKKYAGSDSWHKTIKAAGFMAPNN